MEKLTKEELEMILVAFKLLGDRANTRETIATIREEVEKAYIEKVISSQLKGGK